MRRLVLVLLLVATSAHADGQVSQVAEGRLSFDPKTVYKIPRGSAPAEGPSDAPITIIAWSDYTCGYCNRVQNTLDRLERLYPGQIRWVHRTLPLDDDNTIATEATLAAAAQGRFRPMHERMFALHGRVDRAQVELVARELGLDMLRFRADLDAGTYKKAIADDVADARKLGVTGTPTFFVNGRPVHGNQPLKVFADMVDEELVRASQVGASHPPDLYEALVASGKLEADAPADVSNENAELDETTLYRVGLGLPGHSLGASDALVTIVEWSDFQCPYCAKEAPVLAKLHAKFGDQLRIVYRHMAMPFHRNATLAAEAAVAAAEQGKFWPFHDQIWAHFGQLARTDLEAFAKTVGLDMDRFRAALDDHRYHDVVLAEGAAAEALGVDGTPTIFINGQPIVGSRDEATLDKIVTAHMDHAKLVVSKGLAANQLYAVIMAGAQGEDRADPSGVPSGIVALRADDRSRSVAAACRRRDGARAAKLAGGLEGEAKKRAAAVCAGEGIDLP